MNRYLYKHSKKAANIDLAAPLTTKYPDFLSDAAKENLYRKLGIFNFLFVSFR